MKIKSITIKRVQIVIQIKCDCCGLLIDSEHIPKDWHDFSIRLSNDCYLFYDVCSIACFKNLLSDNIDCADEFGDMSPEFTKKLIAALHNN